MGHERLGTLPKTGHWKVLVEKIAAFDASEVDVSDIAEQTLRNVNKQYLKIHEDKGVSSVFKFLVEFSTAFTKPRAKEKLSELGAKNLTPLSLSLALKKWIADKVDSLEYSQLAVSSAADAFVGWYQKNKTTQGKLFEPSDEMYDIWRKVGTGAGFCELARGFFAKFTERYLNYYLDRVASSTLWNIEKHNQLTAGISAHVDEISRFAFETSQITQSFAAGWFNKRAESGVIMDDDIRNFLRVAFGKMRDDLLREMTEDIRV